jgi:glycosyltransferase involved in cell wall biosynthesis
MIFSGYIPREMLPVYHAMTDLFVFHSTYETFGMVLMEAMSYGSPVVSVRNTAIPDVVVDGKTGVLVPTEDVDAFAGAVIGLLEDDQGRREMGKYARERALKSYSWDTIAEEYEAVLEHVAS